MLLIFFLDAKPELKDLVDLLAPLAPEYYFVGIRLQVPMDTLHFYPDAQRNLNIILEWWINNGGKANSFVCWDTIITAIDHPQLISNYKVVMKVKDFVISSCDM